MKKNKSLLSFIALLSLVFVFSACSSSNGVENPKDALSAFLNEEKDIVAFGNLNINDLLVKMDYTTIPKFGKIINGQVQDWEKIIDLKSPVYYAVQGPVSRDMDPKTTFAFFKIKDKKGVISKLSQDGFDFNEVDNISYTEDGEFTIGLTDKVGIIIFKNGEFDAKKLISDTFKKTKGTTSGGSVDDILENKGDLVLGMNVESLYSNSDVDFSSLSKGKQKELKELLEDAYIQTIFKFEDGAAIIETKNIFSTKLEDKLFFKADKKAPINSYLGKGIPRMGFSINLDMKKMNELMNEFSPEAISELAKSIGPQAQIALMFSGKDGLAAFLDGRIGAVLFSDLKDYDGQIPNINAFIGLTKKGKDLGEDFGSENMNYNGANFFFNEEGLMINSDPSLANTSLNNDLKLPEGCENFGQGALSFFVNLEGVNLDEVELEGEANVLRAVQYITFDYTNEGGVLYIKAKEGHENILKQAMDAMLKGYFDENTRP